MRHIGDDGLNGERFTESASVTGKPFTRGIFPIFSTLSVIVLRSPAFITLAITAVRALLSMAYPPKIQQTQQTQTPEESFTDKPVQLPTPTIAKTVFENIDNGEFDIAQVELTNTPTLVNRVNTDECAATPLIVAISKLNCDRTNEGIKRFIRFLFDQSNLDLAVQDASGNTALHLAVWYGLFDECRVMIQIAKKRGQLDALKFKTDIKTIGATAGDTVLDNIRQSPRLTQEEKNALQQQCSEELRVDYHVAKSTQELNSHMIPDWNTPIMQLLRDLEDNDMEALALREQILMLLDVPGINLLESNFNGDTALHYAIWHGEFSIAEKIIEKTSDENKKLLFAPRNSFGLSPISSDEVSRMNLVLFSKRGFARFIFDPTSKNQVQLRAWLTLCETQVGHDNSKQLVELTHLNYVTTTFPQAAPMITFGELMTECDSVEALHPASDIRAITKTIANLKQLLADVKNDFSEEKVDGAIARLETKINSKALRGDEAHLSYATFIASPDVRLYMRAIEALTRLKDCVNAASATLTSILSSAATVTHAQSSVVVSKVSMFVQPAAATVLTGTPKITLDDLIDAVYAYTLKKEVKTDRDVYEASAALDEKLNDFKWRDISANKFAIYISKELRMLNRVDDKFSELRHHFESALDLINRLAFTLGNPADNHFVDSIERLDGKYKIYGRNRYNELQFIIMNDGGSVEGNFGTTLGIVEQKMYDSRVELFRHFNIPLPESHPASVIAAVARR